MVSLCVSLCFSLCAFHSYHHLQKTDNCSVNKEEEEVKMQGF